jgi:DNA/RNA endonuclease YhcR with UshA esterase domain
MRAPVPALGLALRLAFGFACGLTFAPASALADPITPADTPRHVGQSVTVEGVVSEVNTTDRAGVTFVDMGGHYPNNAFTAIIFKADAGKFPDVGALTGKTIDVTGTIKLYKGKTEIFVNDAAQIKLK